MSNDYGSIWKNADFLKKESATGVFERHAIVIEDPEDWLNDQVLYVDLCQN